MAAAQFRLVPPLSVPVALYVPVALTSLYSGKIVIDELELPVSAEAFANAVKPVSSVNVVEEMRDSLPITPISSSSACAVVAVGPDDGAVLLPVPDADLSTRDAETKPFT